MALTVLDKQPAESKIFQMDFSANMAEAETVASVTSVVATPSGLTIGTPAPSGKTAQVRISSGTTGARYKVTFTVQTSAGNTLEGDGYLNVKNT